jgi:sporulation protein YlmC with PRC-barrel domain
MSTTRIKALLGVMLVPLLGFAQSSHAQGAGAGNDCDRLVAMLQQPGTAKSPLTLDQARTYKNNSNVEACRTALTKMQGNNATGATAGTAGTADSTGVVEPSSPTITVDQASPTVTVHQEAPTVSIAQGRPEVTVRQPAPVITIEIPKPEITVRIPKPTVEVAQVTPQVVVNQVKPDVNAANVTAVPSQASPNVRVSESTNPIIHYESEQPQVHINQAQGEPTLKVEEIDRQAAAVSTAGPVDQGPRVAVAELDGKSVIGPQGQKLGTVKLVILDNRNRPFLIIDRGNAAGRGAKEIPVPAENARLDGDHVTIQGLSQAQLDVIREYKADENYRTVMGDQTISMAHS